MMGIYILFAFYYISFIVSYVFVLAYFVTTFVESENEELLAINKMSKNVLLKSVPICIITTIILYLIS